MKTRLILLLLALGAASCVSASALQRWTVETSRLSPVRIEAYHGETFDLVAELRSYGAEIGGVGTATFLWQTNGMASAWWQAPASFSNSSARVRFTPSMDTGADTVRFFFQTSTGGGADYRASGTIAFRPSPGTDPEPAVLPLPGATLDFSRVTVLNAPWCTLEAARNAVESGLQTVFQGLSNLSNLTESAYAKKTDIPSVPSVDGLASESYVNQKVASVVVPDISGLASTEYVDNKVSAIPATDLTGYALETNVSSLIGAERSDRSNADAGLGGRIDSLATNVANNAAAIAALPPAPNLLPYALKSDLPTGYLTASNLNGYATQTDVDDKIANIPHPDLSGLASEAYVNQKVAEIAPPDMTGYALETNVSSLIGAERSDRTNADAGLGGRIDSLATNVANNAAAIAALPPAPNLLPYALKSDLPTSYLTASNLNGYATLTDVDDKIANIPHPDLSGLASEAYVNQKVASVVVPDISGLASTEYVDNKVSAIPATDLTGYALETNVSSLIGAERSDRSNADAGLGGRIDSLATNVANNAAAIDALNAERETFALRTDLPDVSTFVTTNILEGYASKIYVDAQIDNIDLSLPGSSREKFLESEGDVYLSSAHGDDANDGLSATNAVQTIGRAAAVVNHIVTNGTVVATREIVVSTDAGVYNSCTFGFDAAVSNGVLFVARYGKDKTQLQPTYTGATMETGRPKMAPLWCAAGRAAFDGFCVTKWNGGIRDRYQITFNTGIISHYITLKSCEITGNNTEVRENWISCDMIDCEIHDNILQPYNNTSAILSAIGSGFGAGDDLFNTVVNCRIHDNDFGVAERIFNMANVSGCLVVSSHFFSRYPGTVSNNTFIAQHYKSPYIGGQSATLNMYAKGRSLIVCPDMSLCSSSPLFFTNEAAVVVSTANLSEDYIAADMNCPSVQSDGTPDFGYKSSIFGSVKSKFANLEPPEMTNVNLWDEQMGVTWRFHMVDGKLFSVAVTNVDITAEGGLQ